ncbi:MAG: hypothetical protein MJZ65_05840 [Paludibacteraceae bacterium]|nr:hypothetical protein [Paludibacteraceae bacterium]
MQKKKVILVMAQVVCIALFVAMASASSSQASVPTVADRNLVTPCIGPDYMYVGKFSTYEAAENAAKAMGLDEICYSEQYCFGK